MEIVVYFFRCRGVGRFLVDTVRGRVFGFRVGYILVVSFLDGLVVALG